MEILLRNPIPGDIGWLISLHGKLYAEQFKFDSNFERDIAKKVLSFLETQNSFNMLWIAAINNKPVGSIAVSSKPDQTAFVNFLLVITEYRGRGVAEALMNKVVSHCLDHDLDILRLETYSCLKSARKLYKKYDFTLFTKNVDVKMYGQSFDQEFWEKRL
ncbi:GNAT family acetyltransferase [Desulfobulbus sp. Tol-SR]|jgi:ribosomal protein S18 acetylase RimI-like enzyme|nr:GNAT family acetyltransferase [Desulfobulbus sp. Tol-SR]